MDCTCAEVHMYTAINLSSGLLGGCAVARLASVRDALYKERTPKPAS